MNAISNFTFHNNYNVRVLVIQNEPWFCLSDICKVLTVDRSSDLIRSLDSKGVVKNLTPTNGGNQNLNYINEPNLYRVIFRSNKPEAKQFQDWVFNEVLPTIRKTGRYEAPKPVEKRNYINNNDMLNIKRLIWCCAGHLDQKQSVSSAIWYSLRNVTGVPSPAKFEVEHLPVLAQEFNRILSIIEPYLKARYACEEALIKRLLRDREDAQSLLTKLLDEMKESTSEFNTALQKQLPMVFQGDCLNLVERKPCGIDHHEFNRWA
ncbi:BRO family protein [Acinetobacter gerneri]|uniref:BRO family protein n=1 Tax=Acinetobacter gerneri TaxID=202952 RepID=UPI0029357C35|nr:BRO family protein [Acinetobacter gerneri]MDV2441176.1 BRO family protein [Acinetobacter gerneri]